MNMRSIARMTGAAALAGTLAGCATGVPRQLVVRPADFKATHNFADSPLAGAVAVGAVANHAPPKGGFFEARFVDANTVAMSLNASLKEVGFLAEGDAAPRYTVAADILFLRTPGPGFTMTAKSEIDYALRENASGAEVYHKTLAGEFTGGLAYEFDGGKRSAGVQYESVRMTVQQFLDEITGLAADW